MTIEDCKLIKLPEFSDNRGSLCAIENNKEIPFEIKRIYYLYKNLKNTIRGSHAHKELKQLIIAIKGSFDILLDDGNNKKNFNLNSEKEGLFICPMIWRELSNFSSDAVCLVLASDLYKEKDYYRDYDDFLISLNKK